MAASGSPIGVDAQTIAAGSTFATGAAGRAGTGTLAAGTVTISTTAVTANSIIIATYRTPAGATQGVKLAIPTRTAGTSFVVNGVDNTGATVATDTSTFDWLVIN
jgi:hypothetical protein